MDFLLSATVIVKAFCLTQDVTDCGIVQEVFVDGKSKGQGLVTFEEVAESLATTTGLPTFTIPKSQFVKLFNSDVFEYDVSIVFPEPPGEDINVCPVVNKFEFVTRYTL